MSPLFAKGESPMENWETSLQRGLVGGATASFTSTLALALLGKNSSDSMAAPVNAISHWIWGDQAARHDDASLRYTVPGYLIHHASATFWAVLFERFFGRLLDKKQAALTLKAATAATAVACFTDYQLTPQRLRPGFEKRLPTPALAAVYLSFGIGLAAGAMLCRRHRA